MSSKKQNTNSIQQEKNINPQNNPNLNSIQNASQSIQGGEGSPIPTERNIENPDQQNTLDPNKKVYQLFIKVLFIPIPIGSF